MAISMENVVERPAKRGRHVDMTGYVSPHGLRVLSYHGVEQFKGRNISIWNCECPRCAKVFPIRQNSIEVYKSCGCGHRTEYLSTEAKDLRGYHKQLMTKPERLCERWQDADAFIADVVDWWVTGHILCRIDASQPFSPDNVTSCPADGGTRKSRVVNIGTPEAPDFWSANRLLKVLKFSRTRLHAMRDDQIRRRVMSLLNPQPAPEDPQHPHPRQTASTSP